MNWIDYWDIEQISDEHLWQQNSKVFVEKTASLLNYAKDDIVLDIGCGKGYLAFYLKDKVREVHCIDTSKRNIEICLEKFKKDLNVHCYDLSRDYLNFSSLAPKKFSIIICLSVIQYYANINEVEKLILAVKGLSQANAKFLIADIPVGTNLLDDIVGIIRTAWEDKVLFRTLRSMWRARISEYYQLRKKIGLLSIEENELLRIIKKLNLNAQLLDTRLTCNGSRKHLLIHFSE